MSCIYCGYVYCKCDEVTDPKDQRIAELEAELALKDKMVQVLADELADPYTDTTDEPYEINLPNSWIEWAEAKAKEQ